MDYTVGSLADLISGNKTPNKTKLIQKTFIPIKVEADELNETKSTKKEILNAKKPKSNKKNKLKESQTSPQTDNRKRKAPKNNNIKETSLETSQRKPKGKKRKLDSANADTNNETSPKKQKLNTNEINAATRIKSKIKQENINSAEYKDRTLFVGNIPIDLNKKKLKKHFRQYGLIESVRIRGIPVANPKTTKKVAAIKKEFHPDRNSVYAYIRFKNSEDAKSAEAENGQLFLDHHLRVHVCESNEKPDESKAIFIGNLSFNAEEEELWKVFKTCGPISHVRIVRDGRTGMGKGFGYVNFKDADSVQIALEMEKVMLKDRELRITLCDSSRAKKVKKGKKPRHINRHFNSKEGENNGEAPNKKKFVKKHIKDEFSGTKFNDAKKKKKFSTVARGKKKLAKKLAAVKQE